MNVFLDFINFEYTKEELTGRIQEYLTYNVKAYKLIDEKGPSSAVKCMRPIRQQIDNEYSNYSRESAQKVIRMNNDAGNYYGWLQDVSTKTSGQLTSKNIGEFLYNMNDYAQWYFPDMTN